MAVLHNIHIMTKCLRFIHTEWRQRQWHHCKCSHWGASTAMAMVTPPFDSIKSIPFHCHCRCKMGTQPIPWWYCCCCRWCPLQCERPLLITLNPFIATIPLPFPSFQYDKMLTVVTNSNSASPSQIWIQLRIATCLKQLYLPIEASFLYGTLPLGQKVTEGLDEGELILTRPSKRKNHRITCYVVRKGYIQSI